MGPFPVPSSSCGIPSDAQAYAVNMTVVPKAMLGSLSTWPAVTDTPGTAWLGETAPGTLIDAM